MNIFMMMMSDNFDGENIEEIFHISTTTLEIMTECSFQI